MHIPQATYSMPEPTDHAVTMRAKSTLVAISEPVWGQWGGSVLWI
jgi:hypothetical protein